MASETIRGKCIYNISKCNPVGGHSTSEDFFGYVYCSHDLKPCMCSPYIDWSNAVNVKTDEDVLCMPTYESYMRKRFNTEVNHGDD